jgi:hypothetical protein
MTDDGKRDGMDRAERHADPHWKRCMLESAKAVAERKPFFDSEDVVRWCQQHHPNATTHEQRAIGPLMRSAAALGYCVVTDHWNKSTLPQNHRRPMMAWYSLIYRGPTRRPLRRVRPVDPRQFSLDV